MPDVVVLTDRSGIEVEARFIEDDEGPRLSWIGYESRRDAADGLPTVSSTVLEAARASGTRDGEIDAATGVELLAHAKGYGEKLEYAWIKLCLDANGQITGAHVREASSFAAARAFTTSANAWTFHPVQIDGRAMPVCSLVAMFYPATEHPVQERLPLAVSDSTGDVIDLPREVLGPRIAGETFIHPSERDAALLSRARIAEVTAVFAYCLDDAGAVSSLAMLRSTGLPTYDAVLASGVRAWRYTPYVEPGHTGHVCSAATFIYKMAR